MKKHKNNIRRIFLAMCFVAFAGVILFLPISCSKDENYSVDKYEADSGIAYRLLMDLPDTICVFDAEEFFPHSIVTKSMPVINSVDISSSELDYNNASAYSDGISNYLQIPITVPTPISETSIVFPTLPDGRVPSERVATKSFLIIQELADTTGRKTAYTVTIFPHKDYMTQGQLDSLDFFYNGFFNAVFVYADLDGDIFMVETYIHGVKWKEGVVSDGQTSDSAIVEVMPLMSSEDDIWYDYLPEVVITPRPGGDWGNDEDDEEEDDDRHWDDPQTFFDHVEPFTGGGRGRDRMYMVVIDRYGRGSTTGAGTYMAGEEVVCKASPQYVLGRATSEFISWSGYVNSSSPSISFTIPDDYVALDVNIQLTATFHDINPCGDANASDPLMEMAIQASGAGGWNLVGGTYGYTRNGGSTKHRGMDFSCPVGTPVHATHSGVVSEVRADVIAGETWEDYIGRDGSDCPDVRRFNAGNAVEIRCNVKGAVYTINYYHLSEILVSEGMEVQRGDIIAYSGATGNAGDESSGGPHLHYQVNIGTSRLDTDPSSFIYSKFDSENDWRLINPCR